MSQSTRKKRLRTSGMGLYPKLVIGAVCSCLLMSGIFYGWLRNYLHSDSFRRLLSEKASKALATEGEFGTFNWDGLALESASFTANGHGAVRSMKMDGLRTEIGLGSLKEGAWEIMGSRIQRLDALIDLNKQQNISPKSVAITPPKPKQSGWIPSEVKFEGVEIADATIRVLHGESELSASRVQAYLKSSGNKGYIANFNGGNIRVPSKILPEVALDDARLKFQNNQIFLQRLGLKAWDTARLDATGEFDVAKNLHSMEGTIAGVKCDQLLNGDWAKRLIGELETDFSYNNHSGKPTARGKLILRNGNLTALPIFDALNAYANTKRYRSLALNEAHTDWQWENGRITLNNLVLASDGAFRAEGDLAIEGENLDGTFRFGLPPGILAKIPGASTDVFTTEERGFRWATVRIQGTTKNPKEDLSNRLIAAAGLAIISKIPEVISDSREKAAEATGSAINDAKPLEKGAEIILEKSKTARDILNGLLEGR